MITVWVLLILFNPLGGADFSQVATSKVAHRTESECEQARVEIWARPQFHTRCDELFLALPEGRL
jgi:hypothetical protein